MNIRRAGMTIAVLLLTAGCFHATIETGLQPSGQTIDQAWAHGFVFGLVPPSTVQTASACPNGVARVETRRSFLNQIVGGFTGGLYSPMHIRVPGAASGRAMLSESAQSVVASSAGFDDLQSAIGIARTISLESEAPVLVRFPSLD